VKTQQHIHGENSTLHKLHQYIASHKKDKQKISQLLTNITAPTCCN